MGLSPSHVDTGQSLTAPQRGVLHRQRKIVVGRLVVGVFFCLFCFFRFFFFVFTYFSLQTDVQYLIKKQLKESLLFFLRFVSSCWIHIYLPRIDDQTYTR